MKLTHTKELVDPFTFQKRIHFKGYITPELIQDVLHSGYGMSFEELGKMFLQELRDNQTFEAKNETPSPL